MDRAALLSLVDDARQRTLALLDGLDESQWEVPRRETLNPLRWEVGHLGWFFDRFLLRELPGPASRLPQRDDWYDSSAVPHDTRWSLPLPDVRGTLDWIDAVREEVRARLATEAAERPSAGLAHLVQLAVFHEDMHGEALLMARQALDYPAPPLWARDAAGSLAGASTATGAAEDVAIPGGTITLGTGEDAPWAWDNERPPHAVTIAPFRIARMAVTNAQFAAFVDDDGYRRSDLWTPAGWSWARERGLAHPCHWRRSSRGWSARAFDTWAPLRPDAPVLHVSAHEAEGYCRWAHRRLPTEAEWEAAALGRPDGQAGLSVERRAWPWGTAAPTRERANLDGWRGGVLDVSELPDGDSAFGCRQMSGNVWEWTATPFGPYPGFVVGQPYADYSVPSFGDMRVLRGGAWMSRARVARPGFRNFYSPERDDVFAGFRTCAL